MKITRDAFDLATAAANDSEVPLWLVGDRGIITEILVAPPGENDSLSYYFFGQLEARFAGPDTCRDALLWKSDHRMRQVPGARM